jgi:PAS domain S-box-containing protein
MKSEKKKKPRATSARLIESEGYLSAVLDTVGEGIITVDSSGAVVMVNREFENIWGYARSEVIGQKLTILMPEKYRDAHIAGLARYLETKTPVVLGKRLELEGLKKDGTVFPLEIYISETGVGGELFFTAAVRDITDFKKAAEGLRDETILRKRNEVLLSLSQSDALEEGDLDSMLLEITEADATTLGVDRVNVWLYNGDRTKIHCIEHYELASGAHSDGHELSASDYPVYFKTLENERIIAAHDAAQDPRTAEFADPYMKTYGITSMLDAPIRLKGRMIGLICHEHVGPARVWTPEDQNFAGSIADLISLALEARERKRAEQLLRENEHKFRTLVENTYDYIYEASLDGKFLYLSSKHKDVLGYDPKEFIGKSVFELVHPDDAPAVAAEFKKIIETSVFGSTVYRYRHRDGTWLWFEATGRPYVTLDGKTRILIFSREITERKKAEDALRQTLDHLSKKSRYETIVGAVTRSVHQSTDLETVLENAVQAIMGNIEKADNAAIYFVEGEEAVLKANRGYVDWYVRRVGRIPYPRGYAWKVIMDEEPRYCPDVDKDDVIGPAGRELGIKSYLSLPIKYAGKIIGTININSFQKDSFDEDELKLLEIVGEQISVALGNARQKGALQEAMSEVELLKKRLMNAPLPDEQNAAGLIEGIIGVSEALRKAMYIAGQAASSKSPVLIKGGPGTGKSLFARAIHRLSQRAAKPFVRIDQSGADESAVKRRILGYEERGPRSNALSLSIGAVEIASEGTVYIKNAHKLPLDVQGILLGIIQKGQFKRPGGSRIITTNVRIIAGVDGTLDEHLLNGQLLEDLYHELGAAQIVLPPLRERREDIKLLAEHFIARYGPGERQGGLQLNILNDINSGDWPDNVRGLENFVRETLSRAGVAKL